MEQHQAVFKRYEKKYMLTTEQYQNLMQRLDGYMIPDHYGLHTIGSLYFDTDNFDLIRASIEKPVYKEKLRLRSYGIPKSSDPVFLELKKKYKGIVYKRRVKLSLEAAHRYLLLGEKPAVDSQILQEIDWFLEMYKPVPKVYIGYDRRALLGQEDENLRITFDQNIRFRESNLDLSKGDWGNQLLEPGKILMEIKIPGAMPVWMSQILTELKIFPTSFSKYGTCYKDHLIHKVYQTGGMTCA